MFMGAKAVKSAESRIVSGLVTAILLGTFARIGALAQAPDPSAVSPGEPTSIALPLPEDRGASALEQALRRLHTTASVMMIVAHPDDEDGPLLTYLSRGLGARCTLFTLTRGEGGQNVMSGDTYDALGLIRTTELLEADRYYGVKQLWGTEADFGFSKTQQEAFARWGHDRVLYDAVLAVRRERPQVIVATFVGAVSDGHGQHQVSGEIAQEVFRAAGDPKVFPEQLKDGLQPWQPLAVYGMVPFAPINEQRHDVRLCHRKVGAGGVPQLRDGRDRQRRPVYRRHHRGGQARRPSGPQLHPDRAAGMGRAEIAKRRSQPDAQRSRSRELSPMGCCARRSIESECGFGRPVSQFQGEYRHELSEHWHSLLEPNPPPWLIDSLKALNARLAQFDSNRNGKNDIQAAHQLAPVYTSVLDLRKRVQDEVALSAGAKASLLFELDAKAGEFQDALKELLGIDVIAFRTKESKVQGGGFRGNSADETPDTVSPGEEFNVRVHTAASSTDVHLSRIWFETESSQSWRQGDPLSNSGTAPYSDAIFKLKAPENARPTQPFFTRPSIEQPYYDVSNETWRERSFAPWPVGADVEFTFDGVPIRVAEVVQTLQRVTGHGGYYQPLILSPAIGVSVTPEARILPLDGGALPVKVTIHTQAAADGTVRLTVPDGWHADPAEAQFHRTAAGDTEPIVFSVRPNDGHANADGTFDVKAIARSGGHEYESGWRSVGYLGLRSYNMYRDAVFKTRRVDVKLAAGLRIGYVMGPGDLVPEAIEAMGMTPHLLSAGELASADLSAWNVIVIGIRAYSTRPELTAAEPRLDEFVRNGGTLIVQYQSATFPAPLPLSLGRSPERVVSEDSPVKLLNQANPLLTSPNAITPADFDGWVEERGHSFMSTWDAGYTPLTETADEGQDPQHGGLLVAHPGKGTYIYVAYALYRQLPELVPGAYRLMANLLSAGAGTPTR